MHPYQVRVHPRKAHARRTQHAVGQGGFHSGYVHLPGIQDFRFIYDCGSAHSGLIKKSVESFLQTAPVERAVELLILSHLDEDHVNGVETLLTHIDVHTVLLPYLEPWDRLTLVAEACERGSFTESKEGFISSPADWLRDRGVTRVIYVLPSGDEGAAVLEPPQSPINPRAEREQSLRYQAKPPNLNNKDIVYSGGVQVELLPPGASLFLGVNSGGAHWQFLPFVHPEPDRTELFRKTVWERFKLRIPTPAHSRNVFKKLKEVLKDKGARRELAEMYQNIRRDRNLTSLSLYSGPLPGPAEYEHIIESMESFLPWRNDKRPGWLGTGDANLARAKRATAFAEFYHSVLPLVGSFVLPHHGSKWNFRGSSLPQLHGITWVIAAGENSYGHPDPTLKDALGARGRVIQVSEKATSGIEELILLP